MRSRKLNNITAAHNIKDHLKALDEKISNLKNYSKLESHKQFLKALDSEFSKDYKISMTAEFDDANNSIEHSILKSRDIKTIIGHLKSKPGSYDTMLDPMKYGLAGADPTTIPDVHPVVTRQYLMDLEYRANARLPITILNNEKKKIIHDIRRKPI
jgi:hypothetical protein